MICECPLNKSIPDIPEALCPENFGQIQKVAFCRWQGDYTATSEMEEIAGWTEYLTNDDETKIVVSPYLQAPTLEAGEAITFGGGNETLDGIPVSVGTNPSTFTGILRGAPQNVVAALKQLECYNDIRVWLFNDKGQIGCLQPYESEYTGIPIHSFFVGDKVFGGLEAPDSNTISWSFPEGWSDMFYVINPKDFNPLTDLAPLIPKQDASKANESPSSGGKKSKGI